MQTLTIFDEYMTLGQLLKDLGLISTGGQAKFFLAENDGRVFINLETDNRRGRKLYTGDVIDLPDYDLSVTLKSASQEEQTERLEIKALEKNLKTKKDKAKTAKPRSPFHK